MEPQKKIHEEKDVSFFLESKAYTDIMTFLLQLNSALFPRLQEHDPSEVSKLPPVISSLRAMISRLNVFLDETPPEPGPRRFGNAAFKTWYGLLEAEANELLDQHVLQHVSVMTDEPQSQDGVRLELRSYLLGSFGSSQRLDYGSGHELSFLAFLGCISKFNGFASEDEDATRRLIVHEVMEPYWALVRRLITLYNLEPAGSHGVWGLDDHSFIPYIFGSAQLSSVIANGQAVPAEGSHPEAPHAGDVVKADIVARWRERNLYFGAIGFIYDVKTGPFWEHSPILFDISGVKAGWAKINKGMIKMYIAEVLSKFPVVQHFPFGTFFKWERDPLAAVPKLAHPSSASSERTKVATSSIQSSANGSTAASWASTRKSQSRDMPPPMRAPWADSKVSMTGIAAATTASRRPMGSSDQRSTPAVGSSNNPARAVPNPEPMTKAPWAT